MVAASRSRGTVVPNRAEGRYRYGRANSPACQRKGDLPGCHPWSLQARELQIPGSGRSEKRLRGTRKAFFVSNGRLINVVDFLWLLLFLPPPLFFSCVFSALGMRNDRSRAFSSTWREMFPGLRQKGGEMFFLVLPVAASLTV